MFVVSGRNKEELAWKLANHSLALMSEKDFYNFLSTRYPNCSEHYQRRREKFKTTWNIERAELIGLFGAIEDRHGVLDYLLCQINPQPGQTISSEEVNEGLEAIAGKRVMEILSWLNDEKGGLEKQFAVYQR